MLKRLKSGGTTRTSNAASPVAEAGPPPEYADISAAGASLAQKMMDFFHVQDRRLFEASLLEFFMTDDIKLSDEEMDYFSVTFWPWVFFSMTFQEADIEEYDLAGLIPPNTTIAEMFEQQSQFQLTPVERKYLASAYRRPFCFYEVLKVIPGKGIKVKNLVTNQRHLFIDIFASRSLDAGSILFALAATVGSCDILVSAWPQPFPHRFLIDILDWRDRTAADWDGTEEHLLAMDNDLRDMFWLLHDTLQEQPSLMNTDGDPLSFRTLHYTVESAEAAFLALHSLDVLESAQELRERARLNDQGNIEEVEFNWVRVEQDPKKMLQNITLAAIRISGSAMTVEVNSEAREQAISRHITERLGAKAVYERTEVKSLEAVMQEQMGKSGPQPDNHEELQNHPEIQKALQDMLERHWTGWMDQSIPALGGLTPRQAMQSESGRERLEALIKDAEMMDDRFPTPGMQRQILDKVRKELGLEREPDPESGTEG